MWHFLMSRQDHFPGSINSVSVLQGRISCIYSKGGWVTVEGGVGWLHTHIGLLLLAGYSSQRVYVVEPFFSFMTPPRLMYSDVRVSFI